jgi:alkylresorcinol/alkylpyrone synthase
VSGARVMSVTSTVPDVVMEQQQLWEEHFADAYGHDPRAARIWRSAGARRRFGVVDPRVEDVSSWGTGVRMQRFLLEALPLGKETVSNALADAGLSPDDVGQFAVVSCTGYTTPGLDILLARDLGMAPSVQRLSIGHMGCYAAIPALGAVSDFVAARQRPAVMLCCELTSLHVQPPPTPRPGERLSHEEMQQIVAHALFADAAAAVVVAPDQDGLQVVDVEARTDVTTSDHMTWDITDVGFRMGLSPRVPDVLARHVRPMVQDLLQRHHLTVADVAGWAVHPGGPRILEVVADQLSLESSDLEASYETLQNYGNCSSATVLLVLEHILESNTKSAGGPVVMLAFGPGLTLYAALLRCLKTEPRATTS